MAQVLIRRLDDQLLQRLARLLADLARLRSQTPPAGQDLDAAELIREGRAQR